MVVSSARTTALTSGARSRAAAAKSFLEARMSASAKGFTRGGELDVGVGDSGEAEHLRMDLGPEPARAGRQHEEAVGHLDRFFDVVRDDEDGPRWGCPCRPTG